VGRFFAIVALLVPVSGGCDRRDAQPPPPARQPATAPASLDDRLLGTLDRRRQWSSNGVKIWLKHPTVALDVKATDGKPVRLHVWGDNENDYNTAMMRLNEGAVLYAITKAELEELRTRATGPKVP
jgi:hypothetical protein